MTRGIIQRIFRDHYPAHSRTRRMAWRERHAADQIRTCRTEAQGHHVCRCPSGDYEIHRPNPCKHRSCPVCGGLETDRWIRAQDARVLPGAYHHIVFTIPDGLHPLWRYNRAAFTNLLFKAAWESLTSFLDDPRWLGAMPGAIGGFHSWGETLCEHVHLHLLVTAGGLDKAGRWVKSRESFLCPSRALSVKFRGRFRAKLLAALAANSLQVPPGAAAAWRTLLNKIGRQKWHVQIEPAYAHPHGAIRYLGAYLKRGPIGESRIRTYDGHSLSIAYKRPAEHPAPTFTLSGQEFIRRFLVHVPVKGQRLVRHFGLFHHHQRAQLEQARTQLDNDSSSSTGHSREPSHSASQPPAFLCPYCGRPLLRVSSRAHSRGPPERKIA